MNSGRAVFEKRFEELLQSLYAFGDAKVTAKEQLSQKIEGFIEAGLLLEVTDNTRLQEIVDRVHLEVFGESLADRRKAAKLGRQTIKDWSLYDRPAFERLSRKRGGLNLHDC